MSVEGKKNLFEGSKILVTGATGFIGAFLAKRLLDMGASVSATHRKSGPGNGLEGVNWYQGDLSDGEFVDNVFKQAQPNVVFHLASEVVGARDASLVMPTFKGNCESTVNLLVAANKYQDSCRKLVLTGSLEEPDGTEMDAVPSSPYAAAKWAGSAYARMFHSLYDTPVAMARLFMVYGPAQRDLRKFIPYIILSILNNEQPKLSSGARPVDWVYVDDVVQGFLAIATAEQSNGRQVEIGSGNLVTAKEVALKICELMNTDIVPDFGAIAERPMEQVRKADVDRTKQLCGWQPANTLEAGLQKTIDWYSEKFRNGELST